MHSFNLFVPKWFPSVREAVQRVSLTAQAKKRKNEQQSSLCGRKILSSISVSAGLWGSCWKQGEIFYAPAGFSTKLIVSGLDLTIQYLYNFTILKMAVQNHKGWHSHSLFHNLHCKIISRSSLYSRESFGLNSKLEERNSLIPHSFVWEYTYPQWFRSASDQGKPCAQRPMTNMEGTRQL